METKETIHINSKATRWLAATLLLLTILALIWIVVFKCNENNQLNISRNQAMSLWERFCYELAPFKRVFEAIIGGSVVETLALIFNVVCFIPLGALLRVFMGRRSAVLCGFGFTFAVEVFQLFSGWGGFDFMDMLLNTLGAAIGAYAFGRLRGKISGRALNAVLVVSIAIALPLDVYAVVNTINNFPV